MQTHAGIAAKRRAAAPFANDGGLSPLGIVSELIPNSLPPADAIRVLAGALVNLADARNMSAVKELMKHELFGYAALHEVVQCARRSVDEELQQQIAELECHVISAVHRQEELQARIDAMVAEDREKVAAARQKKRSKIAPAQAARVSEAKNSKIVAELARRKRNKEDYQGRTVCSDLSCRFGVSADHVRKVRKKWISSLRPPKRD
ncbi:DNA-binding protein [Paraburkholderia sediminicola]|uniref:DNA-binding protein n=1 Tax=Paraburkholderia sediminicola TaxID=458836 RepID=UPI0038B7FBD9